MDIDDELTEGVIVGHGWGVGVSIMWSAVHKHTLADLAHTYLQYTYIWVCAAQTSMSLNPAFKQFSRP